MAEPLEPGEHPNVQPDMRIEERARSRTISEYWPPVPNYPDAAALSAMARVGVRQEQLQEEVLRAV